MREPVTKFIRMFSIAAGALVALSVWAADYPAPKEADWVARDFRLHSGETLPEVRLHYTAVGAPSGEPVLVLHGTAGSGATLLTKDFAGELGILEREIKRVKNGRTVLIPASGDTRGHGTTGNAALWKQHLADLLQKAPRMGK